MSHPFCPFPTWRKPWERSLGVGSPRPLTWAEHGRIEEVVARVPEVRRKGPWVVIRLTEHRKEWVRIFMTARLTGEGGAAVARRLGIKPSKAFKALRGAPGFLREVYSREELAEILVRPDPREA